MRDVFRKAIVSTHSRPKAAGPTFAVSAKDLAGFNTQPPEGGWGLIAGKQSKRPKVSTHSRPKAAGL